MIVTIVHVEVTPENIESFILATTENHLESVKEPGNLRFDVLRNDETRTGLCFMRLMRIKNLQPHIKKPLTT